MTSRASPKLYGALNGRLPGNPDVFFIWGYLNQRVKTPFWSKLRLSNRCKVGIQTNTKPWYIYTNLALPGIAAVS